MQMLYVLLLLLVLVSRLWQVGTTFSPRLTLPSVHHYHHQVECVSWHPGTRKGTVASFPRKQGYHSTKNRRRVPWRRTLSHPNPVFDFDKFLEVLGPGLFPLPLILALIPFTLPALPLMLWAEHHYESAHHNAQQQQHHQLNTTSESSHHNSTHLP